MTTFVQELNVASTNGVKSVEGNPSFAKELYADSAIVKAARGRVINTFICWGKF